MAWSSARYSAIADDEVLGEGLRLCSGLARSFGLLSGPHFGEGTGHMIVSLMYVQASPAGVWASPEVTEFKSDERECGSGSLIQD